MDLIKTGGKLEGSRSAEIVEVFNPFINEMTDIIKNFHEPIAEILNPITELATDYENITMNLTQTDYVLGEIALIINNIKNIETQMRGNSSRENTAQT